MKKIISIFCTALVLLTMAPFNVSASVNGDVNNDGYLTIADATYIQRVLAESILPTDDFYVSADFNSNGSVTVDDVTLIQRFLADGNSDFENISSPDEATKPDVINPTEATGSTDNTESSNPSESDTEPTESIHPQMLELDKVSLFLGIGECYNLKIKTDVSDYNFIFYSSNPAVASVDSNGAVTAIQNGIAQIVCMADNGLMAFCSVTVMKMADSVSLEADKITLGNGEEYTFTYILPENTAAYYHTFESDNPEILSIDAQSGVAKAKAVGTATVSCVLSNNAIAKCVVTVKNEPNSLALNPTSKKLKVGEEFIITASTDSGSCSNSLCFTSSNEKVATVELTKDNNARVFAKMEGTTKITVKTYNNITAVCTVTVSGSIVKCLDVSYAQGNIDFEKVKLAGFDYVIIRAGFGDLVSQKDEYFEQNYANAKAAGLKVGAYWFSYSMSVTNSGQEADACLKCIEGKEFDLPVYYDLEYAPAILNLSRQTYNNMASTFCEKIRDAGYTPGIYASASVLEYPLYYDQISSVYSIWNAEWSETCSVKCDMWQYTETNRVHGITCNVDTSYIYNLNIIK